MDDVYEAPEGGYRLRQLAKGRIWAAVSFGASIEDRLAALAPGRFALRDAGPRAWLIVDDHVSSFAEAERALAPEGALVDISRGRARYEIEGPRAREKLAAGIAVDVSPAAFAEGAACETMFNQIGVHLTRTGEDRFELLTGLSFAESLWRELTS